MPTGGDGVTPDSIIVGDCLEVMRQMPDGCVDLIFTSPPYEAARTYGIGFNLRGQDWVDWCVERFVECLRVCRGLVAWNVEGQTRSYRWSAAPALLMADLHRRGIHLRKPPIFHRVGIPGSGGPDWLRNDYEFIVCATNGGRLPWSDNTAMGHPPKWAPGGAMSHRLSDGERVNQWGRPSRTGGTRGVKGQIRIHTARPSHQVTTKAQTRRKANRERPRDGEYIPPVKANPGNVVACKVGGGLMGDKLAHENEAPFPESLAEFFVRSFCPPEGTVLDPFCGSGTVAKVAKVWGRHYIGIDIRESQVELARRRVAGVQMELGVTA